MYKNSVRYKPIASAPFECTPSKSFGVPMLAAISNFLPSLVKVSASLSFSHSALRAKKSAAIFSYSAIVASSGFTITSPFKPSTMTVSPSLISLETLQSYNAAISNERDIIAECDVRPPISVAKPLTNWRFNCTVSLGVKS